MTAAFMTDADLTDADLTDADLPNAFLSGADLSGADLSDADLSDADLGGVIMFYADLSGAEGITNEVLEQQAESLEGSTMPSGQKYEDWLKSKDSGEDGENSGSS